MDKRSLVFKAARSLLGMLFAGAYSEGYPSSSSASSSFSKDIRKFNYQKRFFEYLKSCRNTRRSDLVPYLNVPLNVRDLIQSSSLYDVLNINVRKLTAGRKKYDIYAVTGYIGGRILCFGLASKPKVSRGTSVVLHGMGSIPERCFSLEEPDYMNAIAARLSEAGYSVWCPFIPQLGNTQSMIKPAWFLSVKGISYYAMLLSLAACQDSIFRAIGQKSYDRYVVYGVSIGALLALHLTLIDKRVDAIVASGYLRDDRIMMNEPSYLDTFDRDGYFPTAMNPFFMDYGMPFIFTRMPRIPIFFEIGEMDDYSSKALGRDAMFWEAKKIFGVKGDQLKLQVHPGGHEVEGNEAMKWLAQI